MANSTLPSRAVKIIGQTEEHRPILVSMHGKESMLPRVLILAGQHGDEPIAREGADTFAVRHGDDCAQRLGIHLAVLANTNPDGATVHRRVNGSGIDLNRDHQRLRSPELQALHQFVRDWKPHVVVDVHTFPPRRKVLLARGLVYCQDILLDVPTNLSIPERQRVESGQLLAYVRDSLRRDGYCVDRYTLFRRGGRIRHSTPDIVDARNSCGLLSSARSLLIEARQPTRHERETRRTRARQAVRAALRHVLDWTAVHRERLLHPLPSLCPGEWMTIGSRYGDSVTPRKMLFADATTGKPRLVTLGNTYTPYLVATHRVRLPTGYTVPRTNRSLLDLLSRHGFDSYDGSNCQGKVEGYIVTSAQLSSRANRSPVQLELRSVELSRKLSDHRVFPITQQSGSTIAVFLEPKSKYGLVRVGGLDLPLNQGDLYSVLKVL